MWKNKYPQAFESEWLLLLDLIALEDAQAINITSDNSKKENDRNRAGRRQWNRIVMMISDRKRENIPRDLARMSFFLEKEKMKSGRLFPSRLFFFFLAGWQGKTATT